MSESSEIGGMQPTGDTCGLICGLHSVVICEILADLGGVPGLVCGVVLVFVCYFGCS